MTAKEYLKQTIDLYYKGYITAEEKSKRLEIWLEKADKEDKRLANKREEV